MFIHRAYFCPLVVFALVIVGEARHSFAQHKDQGHAGTTETSHADKTSESGHTRIKVLKGFGRYKNGFKAICQGVDRDGRGEWLVQILADNTVPEEECFACQTFFRMFSLNCVIPKRDTLIKGREPEPPPKKQREPSLHVIDAASRTFSEIAENERDFPENYRAVQKLLYLLRSPYNKSEGQKEYFAILSDYISAPFDEWKLNAILKVQLAEERDDNQGEH